MHVAAKAGKFGDVAVAGQQRVDLGIKLGRCHDQGIGHPKRLSLRAQLTGAVGYLDLNRDDSRNDIGEETSDVVNLVVPDPRASQNLGVGNDRDDDSLLSGKITDCRIGYRMQRISLIEKANDRVGVEDYRHSPRSPSTCARRSPSVLRQPE